MHHPRGYDSRPMRHLLLAVALLLGCSDDDAPTTPDADTATATPPPTCRPCEGVGCGDLPAQCRAIYGERFRAFACDVDAPIVGPGYGDCYRSNNLMCCSDR
jgi:hypothetical protein